MTNGQVGKKAQWKIIMVIIIIMMQLEADFIGGSTVHVLAGQ